MQLNEQHIQVEKLKTDQHISMLLLGINCFGTLYKMSETLLDKHKAKNPTINNKMMKFNNDWLESYDYVTDDFLEAAIKVRHKGSKVDNVEHLKPAFQEHLLISQKHTPWN